MFPDVPVSIVSLAGATPGRTMDGLRLQDAISNPSGHRAILIGSGLDTSADSQFTGVRTRRWVYATYPATGETELYDLTNDPNQLQSRHADPAYTHIKSELEALRVQLSRPELTATWQYLPTWADTCTTGSTRVNASDGVGDVCPRGENCGEVAERCAGQSPLPFPRRRLARASGWPAGRPSWNGVNFGSVGAHFVSVNTAEAQGQTALRRSRRRSTSRSRSKPTPPKPPASPSPSPPQPEPTTSAPDQPSATTAKS